MEKVTYKLLIADDEYWTREKIRSMINWEEYQIIFLKPAENGEEVLQRIREETPDILITDINMPFVNGVDLVKAVKELYPQMVIFVVSGYDDFQYVKETLMAGAINYLLKPVSKIDLVNTISRALEIIGQEEKNRLQILKSASLIQDRELSLLIEKDRSSFAPVMLLEHGPEMAGYSVMLVKIHELQDYMEDYHYDMNLLSYSMKKRIRECTGMDKLLIFNHIYRSNEFIIVTEMDLSQQKRAARHILDSFVREGKSPVTIAVSEHTYTVESIHSAYVQSVAVLMTRRFDKSSVVIFCGQEEKSIQKSVKNRISQELEMQIKGLLKSGNSRALQELALEGIGLSDCGDGSWGYLEVRQTVKRIGNLLLDHLLHGGEAAQVQELESLIELADKTVESLDSGRLCEVLVELFASVAAQQKSEVGSTIRDVIRQAADDIDRNYFEEMTLASLAEKYNVESSYFSRMFKQEMGKNLMLYIAEKRIEKAREYMKDPNINLTEIAFLIGYDDYTYFSRVFKKITGKSPREYRSGCL
jgi:YesN/AraC family two-component response regulator